MEEGDRKEAVCVRDVKDELNGIESTVALYPSIAQDPIPRSYMPPLYPYTALHLHLYSHLQSMQYILPNYQLTVHSNMTSVKRVNKL